MYRFDKRHPSSRGPRLWMFGFPSLPCPSASLPCLSASFPCPSASSHYPSAIPSWEERNENLPLPLPFYLERSHRVCNPFFILSSFLLKVTLIWWFSCDNSADAVENSSQVRSVYMWSTAALSSLASHLVMVGLGRDGDVYSSREPNFFIFLAKIRSIREAMPVVRVRGPHIYFTFREYSKTDGVAVCKLPCMQLPLGRPWDKVQRQTGYQSVNSKANLLHLHPPSP